MAFDKEKSLKLAEKYVSSNKIPAAIEEYRKIAYADPYDLTVLNTLGDLCARVGRTDEATLNFLRVAESYRDSGQTNTAIAVYKKILKLDSANTEVCLTLADLYAKQKLMVDAKAIYQSVANMYRSNGQPRQALRTMERLALIDPENATLKFEIAAEYHQEGLMNEAFEYYMDAGREFSRKGRDTESIQAFQKALSINQQSKPALKALVEALIHQGEIKTALGMLDFLMKKTPDDTDLVLLLGRTYLNARMLDLAEATFTHLVSLDSTRLESLLEVAKAYIDTSQFDRAVVLIERCAEPLIEQNQKKKVTALLKNILKSDPHHLPTLKLLANVYSRVKEKRNLVSTLNMIVEASLKQGLHAEAGYALKQLVAIEPEATTHKEQLENLEPQPQDQNAPAAGAFTPGFETTQSALAQWQSTVTSSTGKFVNPFLAPASGNPFEAAGSATTVPQPPAPGEEISYEYSTEVLDQMADKDPEIQFARIRLLEEMVAQNPEYVEARLKLKQFYLSAGMTDKAGLQSLELAGLYDAQGQFDKAARIRAEAYELNPGLKNAPLQAPPPPPPVAAPSFNPVEWHVEPVQPEVNLAGETPIEVQLALFGVSNRSFFDKFLEREWRRAARSVQSLSLLMVDLDYFKTYREANGHENGDECLKKVAALLQDELKRPGDLIGYYSGDQLMVLLPETPVEGARIVAEKMKAAVENLAIPNSRSPRGIITISLGMASTVPQNRTSCAAIVAAVELALFQSQRAGGNQVVMGQTIV
ncbi:MAG: diguanylate cyclase [Blastocatellia bacterium]|nr:diguanylate cyclase [Blastocatellia bacterium]